MSRPKLSPLSSLLPQKGAATRPEPIGQASVPALMQASKQESVKESELGGKQAGNHKEGARSAVSFRMTEGLQERLRVYAFETRRSKQDVLDDALHEYLTKLGF